jgi:hypothetical protein
MTRAEYFDKIALARRHLKRITAWCARYAENHRFTVFIPQWSLKTRVASFKRT